MNTRPNMKKYRGLLSAAIVMIVGVMAATTAIASLVYGIVKEDNPLRDVFILAGIGGIILSAFLLIIPNIAEDIHYNAYLTQYYGEEALNYHEESLKRLDAMERQLRAMQSRGGASDIPDVPPRHAPAGRNNSPAADSRGPGQAAGQYFRPGSHSENSGRIQAHPAGTDENDPSILREEETQEYSARYRHQKKM